jgi:hypothetical protein
MHTYLPPQIQGWTLADSTHVYDRSTLFSYINGAAEVFLAYDHRSLEVCRYTQSDGPDIQVELFGMGSGEEATASSAIHVKRRRPASARATSIGRGSCASGSTNTSSALPLQGHPMS